MYEQKEYPTLNRLLAKVRARTVLSLSPSETFEDLLKAVQAGRYAIVKTTPELSSCSLKSVYVGSEKSSLSLVQKDC